MVAPLPTAATNATISAPVALTTSKPVRPNPRVTLTSVTPNNVSVQLLPVLVGGLSQGADVVLLFWMCLTWLLLGGPCES